ncbi:RluA family pseudouridine synthase [Texcoconibacillus texcoconensis]|uniref:Pseudouridine synthase n=1 Tax=Texcoconibacillus texcoconensis TaxID=1095777 RepID=A0A840QU09_9BACI|nr:RluA family pseudouridine synthase [Texcoconibacillus texcoconensis]MBB5174854.1 23S rRNA pseudouridine1911/1915/1917 synthase [Texcoconibacillus texcoconensis]
MNLVSFQWIVPKEWEGAFLREFLREDKQISRKLLKEIKFQGHLSLNDQSVTVKSVIKEGDCVCVRLPVEQVSEVLKPLQYELDIIYEDKHILIINKPPYLPTIPSREDSDYSLANAVVNYYEKQRIPGTFHAVNRLDRNTSGLVLIAKHRYAHDLFVKQLKHTLQRTYLAVVHGRLTPPSGTVRAPIARKTTSIIERMVSPDGKDAITHYHTLDASDKATLVDVQLETGRTHQIRVHFHYLGHSLVGDDLYGGETSKFPRQALHAKRVTFVHPFTSEEMMFEAPISDDMATLIREQIDDRSLLNDC